MSTDINTLFDIVTKVGIFLQRPGVQLQLALFLVVLVAATALARVSEYWVDKWEPQWLKDRFSSGKSTYLNLGISIVSVMIFLLLCILGLTVGRYVLEVNGYAAGLLDKIALIFWLLVGYRVLITTLYFFFTADTVGAYHGRLLRPAITLAVVFATLSILASLPELATIDIPTPFGIAISLGAILASTLGLYFWITTIGALSDITYNVVTRRKDMDAGSVQATLTLIRYVAIAGGLVVILRQLRLDSTSVAAIVGGLSVGIGFGLREVLSNFISGVLLLFERSLHPGDIIEVDDQMSVVEDLSIRSTRVRLPNNVIKIIPNQTFLTSSFKNYDASTVVWFSVSVVARYEDDPEKVIGVLLTILQAHPEIASNPAPGCSLAKFAPNGIEYSAFFALQNPMRFAPVRNELHRQIWQAFQTHGFQMPLPQQDIHIRTGLPVTAMMEREAGATVVDGGTLGALSPEARD